MLIIVFSFTILSLCGVTFQFSTTDFYLYTKNGYERDLIIEKYNDDELLENKRAFVFFIHGNKDNSKAPIYEILINTYEYNKERDGFNYILVDWSKVESSALFSFPNSCSTLIERCQKAGTDILTFIIRHDIPPNRVHIIGYSEGAHVAAAAANQFTSWFLKKPYKVTALDPAKRCFETLTEQNKAVRLNKTVAVIVNVLYTNAGGYGLEEPNLGTLNFYANDGKHQPGCELDDDLCCHRAALLYFNESIVMDNFAGMQCDSYMKNCREDTYVVFGPATNLENVTGNYFFKTNPSWPYGTLIKPKSVKHQDIDRENKWASLNNIFNQTQSREITVTKAVQTELKTSEILEASMWDRHSSTSSVEARSAMAGLAAASIIVILYF